MAHLAQPAKRQSIIAVTLQHLHLASREMRPSSSQKTSKRWTRVAVPHDEEKKTRYPCSHNIATTSMRRLSVVKSPAIVQNDHFARPASCTYIFLDLNSSLCAPARSSFATVPPSFLLAPVRSRVGLVPSGEGRSRYPAFGGGMEKELMSSEAEVMVGSVCVPLCQGYFICTCAAPCSAEEGEGEPAEREGEVLSFGCENRWAGKEAWIPRGMSVGGEGEERRTYDSDGRPGFCGLARWIRCAVVVGGGRSRR